MSRRAAQIEDEARRRALLAGPFGLGRPLRGLAPERHYLPFKSDSSTIAKIVGGILGYGTEYAVGVKMATLPATDAGWPVTIHLNDPAASPIWNNVTDASQLQNASPIQHRHVGFTTAGGLNTNRSSGGIGQCAGAQVHAIGRDLTANASWIRIIKSSDQSLFWAPSDAATNQDSVPQDIIVGAYANPDGSLNSGPCNIQLISVVAFHSRPSDALFQAWAHPDCHDARPIFGSALKGYWPVSGMVGASVPALVGSAAMACTGLTAADLVAL